MRLDLDKVRAHVEAASTEDLLDRATVYRAGMEPEALDIIDDELRRRGVGREDVAEHERRRRETMAELGPDWLPVKCCRCHRPAVVQLTRWHRLLGLVPLFPRRMAYCAEHRPAGL
jgi:hypothetical protein